MDANESFPVPAEWEGEPILVALRQALVNTPQGPGYLAVKGTLHAVHAHAIIFDTDVHTLFGPPGRVTIPKNCLAWVNRPSDVVLARRLPSVP